MGNHERWSMGSDGPNGGSCKIPINVTTPTDLVIHGWMVNDGKKRQIAVSNVRCLCSIDVCKLGVYILGKENNKDGN